PAPAAVSARNSRGKRRRAKPPLSKYGGGVSIGGQDRVCALLDIQYSEGVASFSPGFAAQAAYPGSTRSENLNPNGVRSSLELTCYNPVGVGQMCRELPRVAAFRGNPRLDDETPLA